MTDSQRVYDFDQYVDRRSSDCIKWHKYAEDVLPLWVADMDFRSPEPVIQALRERVEQGVFGYPQGTSGMPDELAELRQTIIDRLLDLYGWQIKPEELLFLPGVVKGFNLACQALGDPGDGVLIQTPVYPPFLRAAKNADMLQQEMELTRLPNGRYTIDWQAFEGAMTDRTRVFILCNPHNPVGRVFQQDELERMAEICLQHGVVICSDEIHCDLIFSGHRHIPIASLDAEIARNTITLMAPSKTYNIAGLQSSFAIIQNPGLRRKFRNAARGLVSWVNLMGLTATLAAYRHGGEWLEQLMVYLEANRDYLYEYVQTQLPGIQMAKTEGMYLAWLDCRQASIAGNPHEFFLENAHVALNDGATFGKGGEGFVRLNFGCPRELLTLALERMRAALQSH